MSRNSSGTYTLPTGNPVVSGTVITSTWANDTMGDIASALTDSLSRSGKGGMSAAFRSVDGTVSVPGISFNNETTTGFYRAAAGDVRLSVLGADILAATASGVSITANVLSVQSATAYYPQATLKNTTADGNSAYRIFDKSRGGAIVNSGDVLGNVIWRGFDGTGFIQAASIIGYCAGTPGTNDMPGALGFFTTADGDSSPTRRAYIDASGDLTLDHINANTSAQTANVYVDADGKLYKGAQPAAFASGTVMLFVQTSAPTGWTKSTTHNDKALRVVSGAASSGGSYTFSSTFANGNTGATTLSTAQMPSHTHNAASIGYNGNNSGTTQNTGYYPASDNGVPSAVIWYAGGSGSHTHSLSLAVQYVDVIIATKD